MKDISYYSEVEDVFHRHAGKNLLDPREWALVETWKGKGVPLQVVLRAIVHTVDSQTRKQRKKGDVSLSDCVPQVELEFVNWTSIQRARVSLFSCVEIPQGMGISLEMMVRLLKTQFQHDRTMDKLCEAGVTIEDYEIDLLELVLDALGVPRNYSIDNCEAHGGYPDCSEHPEAYCRGWLGDAFEKMVKAGTDEECRSYISFVVNSPSTV